MKRTSRIFAAALAALLSTALAAAESRVLAEGWRFQPGAADGAEARDYDDTAWRTLRLPHDWAIEGPFDAAADGSTGKLPWKGQGWYRRALELPEGRPGQRVYLDFDGVMAFPKVYVNGRLAGEWDYGYTSFRVDVTPFVEWGGENVIAVHVDTRRWGSRWYPGAGIYRKVSLTLAESIHVAHWGVRVDATPGADGPARARVRTEVENHSGRDADVTVRHEVRDPSGVAVATGQQSLYAREGRMATVELDLEVADALLWDIEHPNRYTLVTTLLQDGRALDRQETRFGFRSFEFTADDGFHLNGRRVQLFGVNLHHDLGPLGGAFNRRAAQRQLEIMQEMGVNALRTAHNPPAPEVLDLCDEMGIVVWDEVFDKYAWTAGRPDLQPPLEGFARRHIEATIRRDFNHPSIVVWSTGNEVWMEEELEGINPERVAMMADMVRELDLSRPVAQAGHIPPSVDGRNWAALDLMGWNYGRRYMNYRRQYPDRPIIYSESASTFSTRGFYDPELPARDTDYSGAYQVSSYDLNAAAWSDIPDFEFDLMKRDSYVAGEFVWTGFDYLGEPTPHAAQARSSYFGIVDLAGFPKDRYWLYRSHWRPDATTVHILPHWNWPNRVGENVPVFVYTNGDAAELFLNGESLGVRRKGDVPERAPDLALDGAATAASGDAGAAADGDPDSEWRHQGAAAGAWWQIDLGSERTVAQFSIDLPTKDNNYAYVIEASTDGADWTALVDHPTDPIPRWSGPNRVIHEVPETAARYLRIVFSQAVNLEQRQPVPVGLKAFRVFAQPTENDYYDVSYDYRLRWNEVRYAPGELKAVAYRDGEVIGEAVVETTGAPARLELVADRGAVAADGEDLVFVTVNALDAAGRPHPLADDLVHFTVEGAGEIEAVGNGNPLSLEPFRADRRQLFYGKALLIVRPQAGAGGAITVRAVSAELAPAELRIETRPATAR
jgi:beta-galactosidase